MRHQKYLLIASITINALLSLSLAQAAPGPKYKICADSSTGAIVAKGKCKKTETQLTLSSFTGPKGDTGDTGTTGATGASAFDPIPSGKTVYGVVGNDLHAAAGNEDFYGFATIPGVVSQVLTSADVLIAGTTTVTTGCVGSSECRAAPSSTCTGSAATPTAPAGKVCIYVAQLTGGRITPSSLLALPLPASGTPTMTPGFVVGWSSSAGGDTLVRAVWAYTAP